MELDPAQSVEIADVRRTEEYTTEKGKFTDCKGGKKHVLVRVTFLTSLSKSQFQHRNFAESECGYKLLDDIC